LVAAVVKAGLVTTLQMAGPYTVFAPNNAAFIALGAPYATAAGINGLDATQTAALKNILLYHVVPARAFSSNLVAGSVATALATKSVTVNLDSGVKITGIAAGNTAGVVTSPVTNFNLVATNGVIHTIDKVLLPQ
jgi:transforming growth factor-beta-induced protein